MKYYPIIWGILISQYKDPLTWTSQDFMVHVMSGFCCRCSYEDGKRCKTASRNQCWEKSFRKFLLAPPFVFRQRTGWCFEIPTWCLTARPWKYTIPKRKGDRLPTIIFPGRAVKLWGCTTLGTTVPTVSSSQPLLSSPSHHLKEKKLSPQAPSKARGAKSTERTTLKRVSKTMTLTPPRFIYQWHFIPRRRNDPIWLAHIFSTGRQKNHQLVYPRSTQWVYCVFNYIYPLNYLVFRVNTQKSHGVFGDYKFFPGRYTIHWVDLGMLVYQKKIESPTLQGIHGNFFILHKKRPQAMLWHRIPYGRLRSFFWGGVGSLCVLTLS